jgi:hypothetical protein
MNNAAIFETFKLLGSSDNTKRPGLSTGTGRGSSNQTFRLNSLMRACAAGVHLPIGALGFLTTSIEKKPEPTGSIAKTRNAPPENNVPSFSGRVAHTVRLCFLQLPRSSVHPIRLFPTVVPVYSLARLGSVTRSTPGSGGQLCCNETLKRARTVGSSSFTSKKLH